MEGWHNVAWIETGDGASLHVEGRSWGINSYATCYSGHGSSSKQADTHLFDGNVAVTHSPPLTTCAVHDGSRTPPDLLV